MHDCILQATTLKGMGAHKIFMCGERVQVLGVVETLEPEPERPLPGHRQPQAGWVQQLRHWPGEYPRMSPRLPVALWRASA